MIPLNKKFHFPGIKLAEGNRENCFAGKNIQGEAATEKEKSSFLKPFLFLRHL